MFKGEKTGFFMHLLPSLKFTNVWYTAKIVLHGHTSSRHLRMASNAGLERTGPPSLIVAKTIRSKNVCFPWNPSHPFMVWNHQHLSLIVLFIFHSKMKEAQECKCQNKKMWQGTMFKMPLFVWCFFFFVKLGLNHYNTHCTSFTSSSFIWLHVLHFSKFKFHTTDWSKLGNGHQLQIGTNAS